MARICRVAASQEPSHARPTATPSTASAAAEPEAAQLKLAAVQVRPAARPARPAPRRHARPASAPPSPPPSPYQMPLYRNGRRAKPSVAPTNFMTSISARRFNISRRMVLPTMSTTPTPKSAAGEPDDAAQYIQHGVQALHPLGVELHGLHVGHGGDRSLERLGALRACWPPASA